MRRSLRWLLLAVAAGLCALMFFALSDIVHFVHEQDPEPSQTLSDLLQGVAMVLSLGSLASLLTSFAVWNDERVEADETREA